MRNLGFTSSRVPTPPGYIGARLRGDQEKACEPSRAWAGRAGQRKVNQIGSKQTIARTETDETRKKSFMSSRISNLSSSCSLTDSADFLISVSLTPLPGHSGQAFDGSSAWRFCAE